MGKKKESNFIQEYGLYGAWGMHLEASNNMMLNVKKLWFV
jgi:hypothetical protein